MKLTDFLIHKKFGQVDNIDIEDDIIVFNKINAILPLSEWKNCGLNEFDEFISKYNFPDKEEFKKKDKEAVRENFPKPQIILKKIGQENESRVAMALYEKTTLTGKTLLHLRSINKFEQMEIRYFLNFKIGPINDPKIHKRGFYDFCQSSDILFDYDLSNNLTTKSARLRIVTLAFDEFILLLYAFDENMALEQEELDELLNSFKAAPNSKHKKRPNFQ